MTETGPETGGWQRLDPRMLLVYPVKELIRFLPVLIGLFVAGSASGNTDLWHGLGIAIPIVLGVLRYLTTSFRIASGRVELRRGLLNRHLLSTPLDRVRTVDITAPLIHRALGLTSVRIGTGTASTESDDRIDLDGLPVEQARRLRTELLLLGEETGAPGATVAPAEPLLRFDPAWVRFAPLTSSGLVIAAGVLGAATQLVNLGGGFQRLDPEQVASDAAGWSLWIAVPFAAVALVVAVAALAIGGYLVTNWAFELTHTGTASRGAWHLRRGLLTTRETTLDDERVRGVSLAQPIGLRLANGARVSAIVTGLGSEDSGSSILVPPAPLPVVERVAGLVLRTRAPLDAPLVDHGPRARARRFTRALWPAAAVVLGVAALVVATWLPKWALGVAVLGVPIALLLARDRAGALGHALVEGHLVARSGSIDRRREVLELDGVIGWNLRATWFQRRSGLTALVATTAGGRQSVTVLDVPEPVGLALARAAHPDLIEQFLVGDPRVT